MSAEIDYISDAKHAELYRCFLAHLPTKQLHNYLPLFVRHLEPVRHQVRKVLEIGVEAGTSLRMWRDYFPNAEIYGFDIDERCKKHEDDRIRIMIGDQREEADLARLPDDFDVIIDDGIHVQEFQISSFSYLIRHKMKERGIYVVEDCEKRMKTIAYFSRLGALINWWPESVQPSDWPRLNDLEEHVKSSELNPDDAYLVEHILGVSIYRHIIFVDKGRNPQDGQARFRLTEGQLCSEIGKARKVFTDS